MWFTETPWPPVLVLAVLAVLIATVGNRKASTRGVALLLIIALAIGVVLVERAVVTERERLEQTVNDLVAAAVQGDVARTVGFIAPRELALQGMVAAAMAMVDVEEDARLTDVDLKLFAADSQAQTHFRVNATISVPSMGHSGRHPSRWMLDWQKIEGTWKVVKIQRLNVLDGTPMPLLNRSE